MGFQISRPIRFARKLRIEPLKFKSVQPSSPCCYLIGVQREIATASRLSAGRYDRGLEVSIPSGLSTARAG
jgi:hypothetical protein